LILEEAIPILDPRFCLVEGRPFIEQVQAAGAGAKLSLVAQPEFERAREIAADVEYIELSTHPGFTKVFARAMYF